MDQAKPGKRARAEPLAALGEEIRQLRKVRGITLQQMAEATGKSVGFLSQVERNLTKPSVAALQDISQALEIHIGWFFQPESEGSEAEKKWEDDRRKDDDPANFPALPPFEPKVPGIIKKAIESEKSTRFDRSHFNEYGNFSLNFETVYYLSVPDYNTYMDVQQAVNLAINEQFEKEGIEFAYPTQTILLGGESKQLAQAS